MDFISAYTETFKQKRVLTPRQKDILDTEKEALKFPFDRNTAIEQIQKNYGCHNLVPVVFEDIII